MTPRPTAATPSTAFGTGGGWCGRSAWSRRCDREDLAAAERGTRARAVVAASLAGVGGRAWCGLPVCFVGAVGMPAPTVGRSSAGAACDRGDLVGSLLWGVV